MEQHGEVSDATAAFVRFAIAAGASLPFADFKEKEVLVAGKRDTRRRSQHVHMCAQYARVRS